MKSYITNDIKYGLLYSYLKNKKVDLESEILEKEFKYLYACNIVYTIMFFIIRINYMLETGLQQYYQSNNRFMLIGGFILIILSFLPRNSRMWFNHINLIKSIFYLIRNKILLLT